MRSLSPLVVVEPHGPLELVSSVQKQHIALGSADLLDHRGSAGHAGKTRAHVAAFPGACAGLLHPGVHVVCVEENQVPAHRVWHSEAQQKEEAESQQGASLRAHRFHRSAARKNPETAAGTRLVRGFFLHDRQDSFENDSLCAGTAPQIPP